jgi:addiction module HigA family antidote
LAKHIGCDVKAINRIVNGRAAVSAVMALKFGAVFDTTPGFWLNAQQAVDVFRAAQKQKNRLARLLKQRLQGTKAA